MSASFSSPFFPGNRSTGLIAGIGSPIVDLIVPVPEGFVQEMNGEKGGMLLIDGDTLDGLVATLPEACTQSPGGSAGNTLFALARLGAAATFVGKVGSDAYGDYYRDAFSLLGGDASRLKAGDRKNARCLSLITPDGERTMRTDLGAAMTLDPAEIHPGDFAGCRHVHVEGYLLFNRDLFLHVVECIRQAEATISLDLASFEVVESARDILDSVLRESIDFVFANEDEAAAFFADSPTPVDHREAAKLFSERCPIAVVKCGADGAWICQRDGNPLHIPAETVGQVVDTTGAGDLWAAGFLFGWSHGLPPELCARIGSILGAEVVQIQGTQLCSEAWKRIESRLGQSMGRL